MKLVTSLKILKSLGWCILNSCSAYEEQLKKSEELARKLHYARNELNVWKSIPQTIQQAKDKGWSIVIANAHQFMVPQKWCWNEICENMKYVSPNWGHYEVIYDYTPQKSVVTNLENMGTYNFFDPNSEWKLHTFYDIMPYVLFWNSASDKTTRLERELSLSRYRF